MGDKGDMWDLTTTRCSVCNIEITWNGVGKVVRSHANGKLHLGNVKKESVQDRRARCIAVKGVFLPNKFHKLLVHFFDKYGAVDNVFRIFLDDKAVAFVRFFNPEIVQKILNWDSTWFIEGQRAFLEPDTYSNSYRQASDHAVDNSNQAPNPPLIHDEDWNQAKSLQQYNDSFATQYAPSSDLRSDPTADTSYQWNRTRNEYQTPRYSEDTVYGASSSAGPKFEKNALINEYRSVSFEKKSGAGSSYEMPTRTNTKSSVYDNYDREGKNQDRNSFNPRSLHLSRDNEQITSDIRMTAKNEYDAHYSDTRMNTIDRNRGMLYNKHYPHDDPKLDNATRTDPTIARNYTSYDNHRSHNDPVMSDTRMDASGNRNISNDYSHNDAMFTNNRSNTNRNDSHYSHSSTKLMSDDKMDRVDYHNRLSRDTQFSRLAKAPGIDNTMQNDYSSINTKLPDSTIHRSNALYDTHLSDNRKPLNEHRMTSSRGYSHNTLQNTNYDNVKMMHDERADTMEERSHVSHSTLYPFDSKAGRDRKLDSGDFHHGYQDPTYSRGNMEAANSQMASGGSRSTIHEYSHNTMVTGNIMDAGGSRSHAPYDDLRSGGDRKPSSERKMMYDANYSHRDPKARDDNRMSLAERKVYDEYRHNDSRSANNSRMNSSDRRHDDTRPGSNRVDISSGHGRDDSRSASNRVDISADHRRNDSRSANDRMAISSERRRDDVRPPSDRLNISSDRRHDASRPGNSRRMDISVDHRRNDSRSASDRMDISNDLRHDDTRTGNYNRMDISSDRRHDRDDSRPGIKSRMDTSNDRHRDDSRPGIKSRLDISSDHRRNDSRSAGDRMDVSIDRRRDDNRPGNKSRIDTSSDRHRGDSRSASSKRVNVSGEHSRDDARLIIQNRLNMSGGHRHDDTRSASNRIDDQSERDYRAKDRFGAGNRSSPERFVSQRAREDRTDLQGRRRSRSRSPIYRDRDGRRHVGDKGETSMHHETNRNSKMLPTVDVRKFKGLFADQLQEFILEVKMHMSDNVIQFICDEVTHVLSCEFKGIVVKPYGPINLGIAIKGSPLEICIYLPDDLKSRLLQKKSLCVEYLGVIKNILQNCVNFNNVNLADDQSTVNFVHTNYRVNAGLLRDAMVLNDVLFDIFISSDKRLISLFVFLMYWSQYYNILQEGVFEEHEMILLIIFYLQRLDKPILPPAHVIQVDSQIELDNKCLSYWHCSFKVNPKTFPRNKNDSDILELIRGFFQFYGSFDFKNVVISPYTGLSIPSDFFHDNSKLPPEFKKYDYLVDNKYVYPLNVESPMCIQDPIKLNRNATLTVSPKMLTHFTTMCQNACEAMHRECRDHREYAVLGSLMYLPSTAIDHTLNIKTNISTRYSGSLKTEDKLATFKKLVQLLDSVLEDVLKVRFNIEKAKSSRGNDDLFIIYHCVQYFNVWSLRSSYKNNVPYISSSLDWERAISDKIVNMAAPKTPLFKFLLKAAVKRSDKSIELEITFIEHDDDDLVSGFTTFVGPLIEHELKKLSII